MNFNLNDCGLNITIFVGICMQFDMIYFYDRYLNNDNLHYKKYLNSTFV